MRRLKDWLKGIPDWFVEHDCGAMQQYSDPYAKDFVYLAAEPNTLIVTEIFIADSMELIAIGISTQLEESIERAITCPGPGVPNYKDCRILVTIFGEIDYQYYKQEKIRESKIIEFLRSRNA